MKIVVFEAEPRETPAFETLKGEHALVITEQPLRADNAAQYAEAEVASTFIYSHIDSDVLDKLPRLRLIATRSTGYDHIDLAACARRSVIVSNVPTYGEMTVAEHVFALLLTISHRMRDAMERARSGRFTPEGLEGFDLFGKTIGVVGTGNIGRHVIRIARGFGMTVLAFDVRPQPRLADELGFTYMSLSELLAGSDIVTLHIPALPQTRNIIDAKAIAGMKRGAILVNTARGDLIDAPALIQALCGGKLAAAGLDVLPEEPLIREEAELICSVYCEQNDIRTLVADHVLLNLPNVIVTPHSAFNTREAIGRIVATTVANIAAFLAGRPINVVSGTR